MDVFATNCLAGRHILITGASSGLGREAARQFANKGARLTLLGRNAERLQVTLSAITGASHRAVTAPLTDLEASADLVKSVTSDSGALDGIFHSAGVELIKPMRMFKSGDAAVLFEAALYGSLGIARAAASRGVLNDRASLVFMSSVAALRGTAGMVGYSASKAAVDGIVRSLACELAPRRIRVNSIAAGAVETAMHERLSKNLDKQALDGYERRHLLGFGQPEDVVGTALFLLSDAARWTTGTVLSVDGGYTAQ